MAQAPPPPPPELRKPQKVGELFNLTLVGATFRIAKEARVLLENIVDRDNGIICTVEREPENPADDQAVKVIALDRRFDHWHLGYIARPANSILAQMLDSGNYRTIKCVLETFNADSGEGNVLLRVHKKEP